VLTIFTVPKPFLGHIGIIQRNAVQSWSRLRPACEIILCGDEPGTEEVAVELKAKYVPSIARNEYGTPLINSVFEQVERMASYQLMCYVNADIILLSDLLDAVRRIRFRRFLMVGQRWDIDLKEPWDFGQPDWEERLRRYVIDCGVLHPPGGSDYFVFPRDGAIGKFPPLAVGRPGWDNWFIYSARKLGIPVVDASRAVTPIHQNHDYSHVPNRKGETYEGPEGDWNLSLIGGYDYAFLLLDATHIMTSRALFPALTYKHLRRRFHKLPILVPATRPIIRLLRMVVRRLWARRGGVSSQ